MKNIIAAFLLSVIPLVANSETKIEWGSHERDSVTYVEMVASPTHFANIVIYNNLTPIEYEVEFMTITFNDYEFNIRYEAGDRDLPDVVTVIAPPGFKAIPPTISISERDFGVIEIHQLLLF